jgi:hypothetical protein
MQSMNQLLLDILSTHTVRGITLQFASYFATLTDQITQYNRILSLLFWTSTILVLLYVAAKVVVKVILSYFAMKQNYSILEVKPLQETLQSSYTTQQLFTLIHGLAQQRSFLYRFGGINKRYSFEIVATKELGIRYIIRVPSEDADVLKKNLFSYLPGMTVTEVTDYVGELVNKPEVTELKLNNHFAFPLKRLQVLDQYDPMAYLTGNMTKLEADEFVSFQVVVSPINAGSLSEIKRISKLMYTNRELLPNISTGFNLDSLRSLLPMLLQVLFFPLGLLIFLLSAGKEGPLLRTHAIKPQEKTLNPYQTELETMVKGKIDQQLFFTSIRLLISARDYASSAKRKKGILSALASFNNAGYQSLSQVRYLPLDFLRSFVQMSFMQRLLGFLSTSVLSVSEVADLYHFPFTDTTKTENLVKTHSKELPAPLSLKKAQQKDIYFANNNYGGTITKIGLDIDERRRHMYILGATGTGKSTLLLSMISQDILNNKGICVIDPHGDLIEKVLQCIPENRIQDVIYFNPDDVEHPIGLNLLELPENISEAQMIREKELITESIISLFHKLYSDKFSGPRMEYILRNTIHTAFTTPNPTLFTIYKLLINEPYRKQVTSKLTDLNLSDFWKYEFSKAGDYQKVKMISPITNKIGRFLFSSTGKRILEQEKSSINFDDIMDSGKILLCNLSKGKIGEDNSEVFGILLMAKIQLAALKRARTNADNRRDFYLYVDEFQNFATPAFAQILSEARKYKLNAILAHQTTSQLEDKSLVNVTLANTGTVICFRTANPEDERLILPQFIPYVQRGEIDKLPSFHFYIKINAITPEEPFSGETTPVEIQDNPTLVQQVIENSRKNYTCKTPSKVVESVQVVVDSEPKKLRKVDLNIS